MSTKGELLALLQAQEGSQISGEEAAAKLGVSRAAVWKAVEALRKGGLQIDAVPGGGYRLVPGGDLLSREALELALPKPLPALQVMEEVDSTNLAAKRWALAGAPHGALVVAQRQTAGRGRLGRGFASPPGGMYLSCVLRPKIHMEAAALMTCAAAVATCRAVERQCGISLGIKWVNDLYYDGKKCCGILAEAGAGLEDGSIEYMVVGIGVNVTTPRDAFPPEVAQVATALFPGGGAPVSRAVLAAAVYTQLMALYEGLETRSFLDEYRARSLVLGRQVTVMSNPPSEGTAIAIDDAARLVVRRMDGTEIPLSYGEISVRLNG